MYVRRLFEGHRDGRAGVGGPLSVRRLLIDVRTLIRKEAVRRVDQAHGYAPAIGARPAKPSARLYDTMEERLITQIASELRNEKECAGLMVVFSRGGTVYHRSGSWDGNAACHTPGHFDECRMVFRMSNGSWPKILGNRTPCLHCFGAVPAVYRAPEESCPFCGEPIDYCQGHGELNSAAVPVRYFCGWSLRPENRRCGNGSCGCEVISER